ncbi:MAG TPA: tetratricopeptide repeat protein [Methanocorpusculum sp.]|nr:tetratricopeptide repeat protein [Methanocorpusculum sp.]
MTSSFQSGLQAFRERRFEEATAAFRLSVSSDRENPNYLYYLGCSLFELGKTQEAVETLSEALKISDAIPIRYMRGEINMNRGLLLEAEDDFSSIIMQNSAENRYWTSLSYLNRSLIRLEEEQIDAALSDITAAENLAKLEEDTALLSRISSVLEKNGF